MDEHADTFDVLHLHFGFDTQGPAALSELLAALRRNGNPLVRLRLMSSDKEPRSSRLCPCACCRTAAERGGYRVPVGLRRAGSGAPSEDRSEQMPSTHATGVTPVRRKGWPTLVVLLVLCYSVAAVGAIATGDASSTYAALDRPVWAPPGWLFGPVWTVLYAMIAVAGWLVARAPVPARRPTFAAWGVQVLLNALLTPLFFGADKYGLALVDICLLLAALGATVLLATTIGMCPGRARDSVKRGPAQLVGQRPGVAEGPAFESAC
ncbi:TspO/MBR family protein [Streptomyces sp. CS131]|uniref:TspO/MBR family protein n=1 Tax=Streptomyces sp. CS131 TaxID=2162711 RepID=UPI001EF3DBF5|nr:TspO/MBR family protein [Streptomyces sp. CS131]